MRTKMGEWQVKKFKESGKQQVLAPDPSDLKNEQKNPFNFKMKKKGKK